MYCQLETNPATGLKSIKHVKAITSLRSSFLNESRKDSSSLSVSLKHSLSAFSVAFSLSLQVLSFCYIYYRTAVLNCNHKFLCNSSSHMKNLLLFPPLVSIEEILPCLLTNVLWCPTSCYVLKLGVK